MMALMAMVHNDFPENIPCATTCVQCRGKIGKDIQDTHTQTHEHTNLWVLVLKLERRTSQILALTTGLVNNAKPKCCTNPN